MSAISPAELARYPVSLQLAARAAFGAALPPPKPSPPAPGESHR
jgi:hypothetical protein